MRLYEFIENDAQVISILTPILLRAKAEGVASLSTTQLANDINDDAVTPEVLVGLLNKHRSVFKNIIASASIDEILLSNSDAARAMTSKQYRDVAAMKKTAVNQAMAGLK